MNAVRRIFLALYSLVLLAALAGIGALAWNQDEKLDLSIGELNIQGFVDASDGARWALTGVLAAIGLFALVTLVLAVVPPRASSKSPLRIRQSEGGIVEVTPQAIEALLRDELQALPEVRRATPRVRLSGGAVDTYLDAEIEPSVSIAQATRMLSGTVEQVLKEHVGVTTVRRPTIRISYEEMAARPAGMRRPMPRPATDPAFESSAYPPQDGTTAQRYDAAQDEAPLTNDGR